MLFFLSVVRRKDRRDKIRFSNQKTTFQLKTKHYLSFKLYRPLNMFQLHCFLINAHQHFLTIKQHSQAEFFNQNNKALSIQLPCGNTASAALKGHTPQLFLGHASRCPYMWQIELNLSSGQANSICSHDPMSLLILNIGPYTVRQWTCFTNVKDMHPVGQGGKAETVVTDIF